MKIGYARVSGDDQNLDLQRDALKQAGCERLYEEKESGGTVDRPIVSPRRLLAAPILPAHPLSVKGSHEAQEILEGRPASTRHTPYSATGYSATGSAATRVTGPKRPDGIRGELAL